MRKFVAIIARQLRQAALGMVVPAFPLKVDA
jgi:hypothetical protein